MQGGRLAVVNSTDLIRVIMGYTTMKTLQAEAAKAYTERETGAMSGMVRSIEAANAPSKSQLMLQAGCRDVIMGGNSRETVNMTTDANGLEFVERLAEVSVAMPDGQGVVLQQAQCVMQAPVFDQAALIGAVTASMALMITDNANKIMENALELNKQTIQHVDNAIKLEGDARKKIQRVMKAVTDGIQSRSDDIHAKTVQIERKARDMETKTSLIQAKNDELEARNSNLEKRINSLEAKLDHSNNKKPRTESSYKYPSRPQKNITRKARNNTFGWTKTVNGKKDKGGGYSSIEEARQAMDLFYKM